jgi:hypothetical protein
MMVERSVRVSIELPNGRGTQRCQGPVWDGLCPHAAADGSVPCAGGRILLLHGTWADGTWLAAPAGAGPRCPVAGLVSVAAAPWD